MAFGQLTRLGPVVAKDAGDVEAGRASRAGVRLTDVAAPDKAHVHWPTPLIPRTDGRLTSRVCSQLSANGRDSLLAIRFSRTANGERRIAVACLPAVHRSIEGSIDREERRLARERRGRD